MKNIVIGTVVVLAIAGGAYYWFGNQNEISMSDDVAVHAFVVEVAVPVRTQLKKSTTGNPIGYNPGMVSVTLTLRFENADELNKARAEIRQLRRGYSNAIGAYLAKGEPAENRDADIRTIVATASAKLLGTGSVIDFDVEVQFEKSAKN